MNKKELKIKAKEILNTWDKKDLIEDIIYHMKEEEIERFIKE